MWCHSSNRKQWWNISIRIYISESESSDYSSTIIERCETRPRQHKRPRHFQKRDPGQSSGATLTFKNTNALCGDLEKLLNLPEMCDIKFLVGKTKTAVYGVKAILATRNRYVRFFFSIFFFTRLLMKTILQWQNALNSSRIILDMWTRSVVSWEQFKTLRLESF